MKYVTRASLFALALFATTLFVGGCSSSIESSDLRSDWTPELHSTSKTYDQYYNMRTRYRNNTWRQIADDWAFIWLEDRNLRLTKYNLP